MATHDETEKLYRISAKSIGKDAVFEYLVEECAELIVAVKHLKRRRISLTKLIQELSDVETMIGQLKELEEVFDWEIYAKIQKQNFVRLHKRIDH